MRDKQSAGGRGRGRGRRPTAAKPAGGSSSYSSKNPVKGGTAKPGGPKTKFTQRIGTALTSTGGSSSATATPAAPKTTKGLGSTVSQMAKGGASGTRVAGGIGKAVSALATRSGPVAPKATTKPTLPKTKPTRTGIRS